MALGRRLVQRDLTRKQFGIFSAVMPKAKQPRSNLRMETFVLFIEARIVSGHGWSNVELVQAASTRTFGRLERC